MKRVLLLLLTFLMCMSCFSLCAFGAENVPVPVCKYAQAPTGAIGATMNIRFVSEISKDIIGSGASALGYDIKAIFKSVSGDIKYVDYNKEGNKVYSSLKAGYGEITPSDGTYFFSLTVTDVPTTRGKIFFEVTPYTNTESGKLAGETSHFCFDGKTKSESKLMYSENFDSYGTVSDGAEAQRQLGWINTVMSKDISVLPNINISNGKAEIKYNTTTWHTNEIFNAPSVFAGLKSYEAELDVTIPESSYFAFVIQHSGKAADYLNGESTWIFLRGHNNSDWSNPNLTNVNLGMRMISYNRSNDVNTSNEITAAVTNVNTKISDSTKQFNYTANNTVRLKVCVDSEEKLVSAYINGSLIMQSTVTNAETQRLCLLTQHTDFTVDNISVSGISNGATYTSTPLKIMSFNVENGWNGDEAADKRVKPATDLIYDCNPDIIGFQEYDPSYRDEVDKLGRKITDVYTEVNVTGADENRDKSWNPIFYNPQVLTLDGDNYGYQVLEGYKFTSYNYNGKTTADFRTVSWAIFTHNKTGEKILFVNTHFEPNIEAIKDTVKTYQKNQVEAVLALIQEKKTSDISAVFVTGDFNASRDPNAALTPAYKLMTATMSDTWDHARSRDSVDSSADDNKELSYTYAIDHVLFEADMLTVKSYETVGFTKYQAEGDRDLSDHFPIVVSVEINKQN